MRTRSALLTSFLFLISILGLPKDLFSQNVGIGTPSPTGKLQVNHRSDVPTPGLLMLDSTTNRSGNIRFRNINSTKYVELWGFSGNNSSSADQYLDIESDSTIIATFRGNGRVGVNNIAPAERLDVNGNINLTGQLKINGNAGSAGQVLTSNGAGDPQWKNAAYANNTRFYVEVDHGATVNSLLVITNTRYNTNPTDIVINSDYITVNRTGLYHLDGFVSLQVVIDALPSSLFPSAYFRILQYTTELPTIAPGNYSFYKLMTRFLPTVLSYQVAESFSQQVYIVAGQKLALRPSISAGGLVTSFSHFGQLRGHLISE